MNQQLIEEIAGLYEGSRHGNSRFIKRMKTEPQEVQDAVNALLGDAPLKADEWNIKMPLEELVSIHLNAAGVPNTWFVQNFKKLSPSNQARVNARLTEIGHEPYLIKGKKGQKAPPPQAKVLNEAEKEQEQKLVGVLRGIRLDRKRTENFLARLDQARNEVQQQLCELRGVPYREKPIYDKFTSDYRPAHACANNNKEQILASEMCGCFFCRSTFKPPAIMEWVNGGTTALCPKCGIDAVIGDKSGFELSDEFLLAMFVHWFSIPLRIQTEPIEQTEIGKAVSTVNQAVDTVQSLSQEPETPTTSTEYTTPSHLLEDDDGLVGLGRALATAQRFSISTADSGDVVAEGLPSEQAARQWLQDAVERHAIDSIDGYVIEPESDE